MLREVGSLAVIGVLITGCGALSAPVTPLTPEQQCDRDNGVWRPVLNLCEHGR